MIEIIGNQGIVANERTGFTFELTNNPREFDTFKVNKEELPIDNNHYIVDKWRILPYGCQDNLPQVIQKAVEDNGAVFGMLEKKVMMYMGNGPFLYDNERIQDGAIVRNWVQDDEIQDWLDSWKSFEYLVKCGVDYEYMKGSMSKFFRNKGSRLLSSKPMIAKLDTIMLKEGRLACPVDADNLIPTHIVETDHTFTTLESIINYKVYPLFDPSNPFEHQTSAYYSNQYTFGNKNYSTPPLFGSLEWLRRSTATPIIFKALSKQSIHVNYHVESPQEFWDREEERLKDNYEKAQKPFNDQVIIDYRNQFMKDLLKVLTGEENVGKVWHTRKILEVQGTNLIEHGWTITPIPQNIKDFVAAQIKISERADRVLSANLGMNSSLSNISEAGKPSGGSEQVYAMANFINSSVDLPEYYICKAINYAIKVNWPNKKIKLGFHRNQAQTLSEISPGKRPVDQKKE